MAMTAWSAKVSRRATCRSVKSCGSVRRTEITPMAAPSFIMGTLSIDRQPSRRAITLLSGNSSSSLCALAKWSPCLEHRPACDGPADDGKGGRRGDGAVMGNRDELVVFPLKDGGVVRVAQASGGLGHGVEYRLNVGRRARDHSQDLRSRRLLVQRLFRLVEQADILNGDDCLIGKGSHQLDLL